MYRVHIKLEALGPCIVIMLPINIHYRQLILLSVLLQHHVNK
jgi:hypothetical protein